MFGGAQFSTKTGTIQFGTANVTGVSSWFSANSFDLNALSATSNDLPFVLQFDYSLRDPSGNTVCTTCPSGFAFMLADQSDFQPGGSGNGFPGFGLAPGVQSGKYHTGLLFDHLTVCNTFSNTSFHGLYTCVGTNSCTATSGSPTNNPLPTYKLNGCTQDHHVMITLANAGCIALTTICNDLAITVQIDGVTTYSNTIAKAGNLAAITVPAYYWGFTTLSPTNNLTIYNIEYAYQTTAGANGACFDKIAGCKEGTNGYNNNVSAVCVLNSANELQRTCACASGYATTDYSTFSNQPTSVAFPRCLASTSQCSRFGCDKFATCSDTGPYTRTCTCPYGYTGTATGLAPGVWATGCVRNNPCSWRSITSNGQLVQSGGAGSLNWLASNTTFMQLTGSGTRCAWYNISSNTAFALSALVQITPNNCPSGSPTLDDITGQFSMAVNSQSTAWCGTVAAGANGVFDGAPATNALGWELDPVNLLNNLHFVRDVCSNSTSAVSTQTSNCWNGYCNGNAQTCSTYAPWFNLVMYYYPPSQPGTNTTEATGVVTYPNGVFALSLGSSTTYDVVRANTSGVVNFANYLSSSTVFPGFVFGDGKGRTVTVGNMAIVQSSTCPASCLASSCGDDTYNRGRVTCTKGSTRPEDTRTCKCIPGYDFGPYTFADQGLAVLAPYCVPTLYFCNTYGGCGANAVCSELSPGSNGRLCTCNTGYTTVSGITNWTLYGAPGDGQGYFGGKITTLNGGDGCTVQVDMCAQNGCGANSYCTNGAGNQRTCTCQIGWQDSLNRTSVSYTGNTTAADCSVAINTCGNDFNVACTFRGLLTRFLNCTNGFSVDGGPNSTTSKLVYGINNPFSCYSINFCAQGCGVNATCLSTFNTRHCTCTAGMTFNSSGSALGSNFSIVGVGVAPGCPYEINYCLQNPNGAGTPLGSPATNYGCNNLHTSCVPGFRTRLCTCDPGYSLDGLDYYNNNVTVNTIQFGSACIALDMCLQFGCDDSVGTTCTLNGANSRICECATNYEVNASSHLTSVALNGPVAWGGCTPIDYCTLPGYGCGSNANCVNSGVAERTCTCINGYTSSANNSRVGEVFKVYNDDISPGCTRTVNGCLSPPDGYGCGAHANCTRLFNAINCQCSPGYGITADYFDNNITLVYTQTYGGCNTVIDMCDQFGCVANEAPYVNCSNFGVNKRECDCPPGYSGSDMLTGPLNHTKTCQSINLCTLYGCGSDPNAVCKSPANFTGNRTCECNIGYDGTEELFNDTAHTWCREIDMCKRYGCQNFMLQCSFVKTQANKRTCSCAPGTAEYAGSGLQEFIIGNGSSSITCTDLNECDLYPCTDPRRNQSTTCIEYDNSTGPKVNQRVCQCPNGFVGTAAVQGDNEFLGCAPPLAVSGIQSLGFTLQNGFWNKWQFFTVLDINLDGIKDFFYQDTAGELGYIIFHSAFVWKQYPALDAIHNKNQYCANPKPYAFDNGPPVNVICMNKSGDVLLYVWENETQFFYQFPLTTGAFTFNSAPESDYWEDSTGTGYVLYNDANRTLILRRPSFYNYTSHALDLQVSSYANTFTAPPTQFYGIVVRPVMFDINGDDKFDAIFGWDETENEKFSWYLQSSSSAGSFSLLGELSTLFTPEHVTVARLSTFAPNQASLIATTSTCYALYYLPDVTNVKPNDRAALEDASCSNCGCGTSQGLVLGDLNADGQLDLAVLQNGGASFYYGFYSENNHFGFTSVLLLGGADHLIFYPWENTALLQAMFISDGVSAVYSFLSGDECAMGTHDCPQNTDCIYANSGFGRYGFICNCSNGFYEVASTDGDPRHFTCADVDECAVIGANGNPGGCGLNSTCVNTPGSFYCNCTDGYFLLSNKITCIESLDCAWFDWTDWGTCSCGIELRRQRIEDRSRSVKPDSCLVADSLELRMCDPYSFCVTDDLVTTIEQARNKLLMIFSDIYMQYAYGQFYPYYLLVSGGNHSSTNTSKRDEFDEDQTVVAPSSNPNLVVFDNPYCNSTELANATTSLLSQAVYFLALPSSWILAKASYANNTNPNNSYIYDGANCTAIIDLSGAFPASYIGLAVGIPVGLFFLLTFIAIIIYLVRRWLLKKRLKVVKNLPRECTVHYRDCIKHPDDWEQIETDPPTWRKELTKDDDKEFVLDLFNHLDGDGIGVKNIYAVYNRSLVTQLSLTKQKFDNRASKDSQLFFAEKWKMQEESESRIRLRQWTKDNFLNRMSDFEWNHNDRVGILPVIHGTSINIAWKVCVGGFANLSVLDVGFYGSGIYFTTSAKYSIPYFATKPNPAIIISYLIPGNPFPVVEQPSAKDNIAGNTLKPGYQSHFVSTTSRGVPHTKPTKHHVFDEIVINQESQVAPAYVLVLDTSSFISLIKQFERKTLEADVALNSRDVFSDNRDRDGYMTI